MTVELAKQPAGAAPAGSGAQPETAAAVAPADAGMGALHDEVVLALQGVFDPEIPVNIYDLGLIYGLEVDGSGDVRITMTLTTPHCPVAESMPGQVREVVECVQGVRSADVEIVWDPPWDRSMMSDNARMALDMY